MTDKLIQHSARLPVSSNDLGNLKKLIAVSFQALKSSMVNSKTPQMSASKSGSKKTITSPR